MPIMTRRPTASNSRPRKRGPRKLPAAKGKMYQPTWSDLMPCGEHQRVSEENCVIEERLRRHQTEADERASAMGGEQRPPDFAERSVVSCETAKVGKLFIGQMVAVAAMSVFDCVHDFMCLIRPAVNHQPARRLRNRSAHRQND